MGLKRMDLSQKGIDSVKSYPSQNDIKYRFGIYQSKATCEQIGNFIFFEALLTLGALPRSGLSISVSIIEKEGNMQSHK